MTDFSCEKCINNSDCKHKEYRSSLASGIQEGLNDTPFYCNIGCKEYVTDRKVLVAPVKDYIKRIKDPVFKFRINRDIKYNIKNHDHELLSSYTLFDVYKIESESYISISAAIPSKINIEDTTHHENMYMIVGTIFATLHNPYTIKIFRLSLLEPKWIRGYNITNTRMKPALYSILTRNYNEVYMNVHGYLSAMYRTIYGNSYEVPSIVIPNYVDLLLKEEENG